MWQLTRVHPKMYESIDLIIVKLSIKRHRCKDGGDFTDRHAFWCHLYTPFERLTFLQINRAGYFSN